MSILGYNVISSNSFTNGNGNNQAVGNLVTCPDNGTLDDFNVYIHVSSGSGSVYGAVYEENGANWDLVGQTTAMTLNTTPSWRTASIAGNLSPGINYLLMYWVTTASFEEWIDFNTGKFDFGVLLGAIAGTFPSSIADTDITFFSDSEDSVYVNYTIVQPTYASVSGIESISGVESISL